MNKNMNTNQCYSKSSLKHNHCHYFSTLKYKYFRLKKGGKKILCFDFCLSSLKFVTLIRVPKSDARKGL